MTPPTVCPLTGSRLPPTHRHLAQTVVTIVVAALLGAALSFAAFGLNGSTGDRTDCTSRGHGYIDVTPWPSDLGHRYRCVILPDGRP